MSSVWGGPCWLCGGAHEGPSDRMLSSEDEVWQRRICVMMNENPGMAPRHAIMFVQMADMAIAQRKAALAWEREKGSAFAEGMISGWRKP